MKREKIHCYMDGNCDRFFDDFYNLKGLIILNMYRIIQSFFYVIDKFLLTYILLNKQTTKQKKKE